MALEHAGEALAHLRRRLADRDSAGDVGGAVLILRAGIDQDQLARLDRPIGLAGDAIVHDGAVRPGARDGWEGHILERAALAPESLQGLDRIDLGELAARRFAFEPGEEARHRSAVAL